mmetsp:Transcript_91934/g.213691  ORF Transcript_91934/g.213691 Transcript_91934/m.213691 type:complete len:226 (-) Transcript_91934:510-1187(-)
MLCSLLRLLEGTTDFLQPLLGELCALFVHSALGSSLDGSRMKLGRLLLRLDQRLGSGLLLLAGRCGQFVQLRGVFSHLRLLGPPGTLLACRCAHGHAALGIELVLPVAHAANDAALLVRRYLATALTIDRRTLALLVEILSFLEVLKVLLDPLVLLGPVVCDPGGLQCRCVRLLQFFCCSHALLACLGALLPEHGQGRLCLLQLCFSRPHLLLLFRRYCGGLVDL